MAAVNPIRIVPLHGDALAAPVSAPQLTYRGGPLLPAAQVFIFFWGTAWQGAQAALVQQINQFFDFVLTSPLLDQLGEYSVAGDGNRPRLADRLGHPEHRSAERRSPTADVQQLHPAGDRQRLRGAPAHSRTRSTSCICRPGSRSQWTARRPARASAATTTTSTASIFYAVMPYPDCAGCTGALTVTDALTSTSSHELCEAITDPVPGQGWYDDQNGEIGDICAWKTKKLGAYTVQLEWSNKAGQCI